MAGTDEWTRPEWLTEARAWIDARLAEHGAEVAGDVTQPHLYWWSTVLRVPTRDGVVWFKAARPHHAFEGPLTVLLARLAPEHTVVLLANDHDRGWMLMRDAGVRMREVADGAGQIPHWEALLPRYAELQIELAPRTDELLALGVPDHRLEAMPGQLQRVLSDDGALLLGHEDGLAPDERERLLSERGAFADLCERLAACGVPETLQHDDLHDGNAFVRDGQYVFFDWGDSCVSHPFHTLAVTLRALAYKLGLEAGGAQVTRLRDTYLEPWTRIAPRRDVEAAADLARRTGSIQRALTWYRFAQEMPADVRADYVDSVPYGLKLYLAEAPWGAWEPPPNPS